MKKVIIDTDPGIDDAMAILFAHGHGDVEILGITTTFGNATLSNCTRNALYLKERFGLTHTTICQGSDDTPLVIPPTEPATFVHGQNGLGDIDLSVCSTDDATTVAAAPTAQVDPRDAVQFIIDSVTTHPGEITLVALGRLTNLARALQRAPDIVTKVKEVILMGGAFGHSQHTGNVTPVAEANIWGDPHAADAVFTAQWSVTAVGLDVTQQTIMTTSYLQILRDTAPHVGGFIWDMTRFYENFHRENGTVANGFFVHDSSALLYLTHRELFTTQSGPIRVVTEGPAMGHTLQKPDGTTRHFPFDEWRDYPSQQICIAVDSTTFLQIYTDTIVKLEENLKHV